MNSTHNSARFDGSVRFNRFTRVAILMLITLFAAVAAAAVAVVTAHGLSFGLQAARDGGEYPPLDVSQRIEQLMTMQAYGNAFLTGVALAVVLSIASNLAQLTQEFCHALSLWRITKTFLLATVIGGSSLLLACLAFRLQPVGSQDLIVASLIHCLIWMLLGIAASQSFVITWQGKTQHTYPILAGMLWGECFPVFALLLQPDVYVERLFATNLLVALWAAGGCLAILLGAVLQPVAGRSAELTEMEPSGSQ